MHKSVWSMCGMCTVRCPIRVEVADNRVIGIEGNPHLLAGALCAKGAAGMALVTDQQRPRQPLIRRGDRGAGRWDEVSWQTAYDHVAEKLSAIIQQHGPESIMMSCRGGPFVDLCKAFIHGLGSPNFTDHDSACGSNVHHASLSVYGLGRKGLVYDIKNTRHLVLFGRNLLASLQVGEANQVLNMLEAGGRMTYIDCRQTITGTKATRFFQVRPGTDYAFALGLIHQLILDGAYDQGFVNRYVTGFAELTRFVEPYSLEWAAKECGVRLQQLQGLVAELTADRPRVIFHPGWMLSRYPDSFYASRAIQLLNVLMGNIEIKGGQILAKGPGDYGVKGLRSLDAQVPRPSQQRGDGVGWRYPQFDPGPGLGHLFYETMRTQDPYPLKGVICYRHDPFSCFPDPTAQKEALDQAELLVSIDTHYSEFGWYSDVILPESTYLERDTPIATQKGMRPRFIVRRKAVEPTFDSKPSWEILQQLAQRLGYGRYFPYQTIEDLWAWQLQETGLTMQDFADKGFVELTTEPLIHDREQLAKKFKTPSGTIEVVSQRLTAAGLPSLKPYASPAKPPKGKFRLVFGRSAVHSHSHTINNPLLNELMPENTLWINKQVAARLGISDGDWLEVEAAGVIGTIHAQVTDFIHPEAVYTVHGFGRQVPLQTRAYHAGMSDQKLMRGMLQTMDQAGGGLCLCQTFVSVRRSNKNAPARGEL
jgi:thiosulfate reductase/polysulfide reductase chain A